jgi:hypothetical protein
MEQYALIIQYRIQFYSWEGGRIFFIKGVMRFSIMKLITDNFTILYFNINYLSVVGDSRTVQK